MSIPTIMTQSKQRSLQVVEVLLVLATRPFAYNQISMSTPFEADG
jgi:TusA-related sulfurtransferase